MTEASGSVAIKNGTKESRPLSESVLLFEDITELIEDTFAVPTPLRDRDGQPTYFKEIIGLKMKDGSVRHACGRCNHTYPGAGHVRAHIRYDHTNGEKHADATAAPRPPVEVEQLRSATLAERESTPDKVLAYVQAQSPRPVTRAEIKNQFGSYADRYLSRHALAGRLVRVAGSTYAVPGVEPEWPAAVPAPRQAVEDKPAKPFDPDAAVDEMVSNFVKLAESRNEWRRRCLAAEKERDALKAKVKSLAEGFAKLADG